MPARESRWRPVDQCDGFRTLTRDRENSMGVRQARRADLDAGACDLAAAFAADPWFRWLYPDDAMWPRLPTAWFALVLDRAFPHGHTYVTDGGICNWIPPDVHFPGADDVQRAVELLASQIGERASRALGFIGDAGAEFPDEPRFHCVYVGVEPTRQGEGCGRALLGRVLDVCDRDGIAASLTSTNDANLALYRSLGFRDLAEVPVEGFALRPMWREPGLAA
jgi:GNAT superfamily N-acetyltransferase